MTDTVATALQEQKGTLDAPRCVLFVCTGNTCRSPMAAALYNDMVRREVCTACTDGFTEGAEVAFSAGLYANEGEPISADAVAALREAHVMPTKRNDYTAHRARTVTRAMMEEADKVIAISGSHAMELMLRFPEYAGKIKTLAMNISDPYGRGIEAYRECLMQLRYCLQLLTQGEDEI